MRHIDYIQFQEISSFYSFFFSSRLKAKVPPRPQVVIKVVAVEVTILIILHLRIDLQVTEVAITDRVTIINREDVIMLEFSAKLETSINRQVAVVKVLDLVWQILVQALKAVSNIDTDISCGSKLIPMVGERCSICGKTNSDI